MKVHVSNALIFMVFDNLRGEPQAKMHHIKIATSAAFCAASTLLSGCQTSPEANSRHSGPPPLTIPYRATDAGAFVIDVWLDDIGPLAFLIDTGASASGVFAHAAATHDLPYAHGRSAVVRGLIDAEPRPLIDVQTLSLRAQEGSLDHPLQNMVVFKDSQGDLALDGVLGMDVLAAYALIFDTAGVIGMTPANTASLAPYRTWRQVALHDGPVVGNAYGLRFVDLALGPLTVPALIDTGSPATIINRTAMEKHPAFRPQRRWDAHALEGATGATTRPLEGSVSGLAIGDHMWGPRTIFVLDMEPLAVIGAQDGPFAVAGANLWVDTAFVLDFGRDVMFIAPGDSASSQRRFN